MLKCPDAACDRIGLGWKLARAVPAAGAGVRELYRQTGRELGP